MYKQFSPNVIVFHQQDSVGLNEDSDRVGFEAVLHGGSWNSVVQPTHNHPLEGGCNSS